MRCSQARRLISDYIDNELGNKQTVKLEDHLQNCLQCKDLFNEMRTITSEAKHFEHLSPHADLWPAIRNRIAKDNHTAGIRISGKRRLDNYFRIPLPAAFPLGAVLASVIIAMFFYYGIPSIQNHEFIKREENPQKVALIHFKEAEQHYQLAIRALNSAISGRQMGLDPELVEVFRQNLEIIDNSIRICRTTVRTHPDSLDANIYLLACYRKKIGLLNEIRNVTM